MSEQLGTRERVAKWFRKHLGNTKYKLGPAHAGDAKDHPGPQSNVQGNDIPCCVISTVISGCTGPALSVSFGQQEVLGGHSEHPRLQEEEIGNQPGTEGEFLMCIIL